MPISEFRETLSVKEDFVIANNDYQLFQRKINLRDGQRHTVNFIDFYDDSQLNFSLPIGSGYLFYVSKYPVIPTGMEWAELFGLSGPPAADPNVLFKASYARTALDAVGRRDEFPNQFLGSSPTFTFYSNHVYLTLILYNNSGGSDTIEDPQMSVYMAIDSKNVDSVEYMMGFWTEYQNAQLIGLLTTGVLQPDTPGAQAGKTFPMWLAGGIRPERMLRADALADWWHNLDGNFAEKTQSVDNLRTYYNTAKTMVSFDSAFGGVDVAKGDVPDWIRLDALPSVISGPERAEFPIAILPTAADIAAGVNNVQVMV
jgi:hypothetical protein